MQANMKIAIQRPGALSKVFTSSNVLAGQRIQIRAAVASRVLALPVVASAGPYEERFRLHNLSPHPDSKRPRKRKGRGYGAGQGGSCGFGMRGQKSRGGPGIRSGFEGGQTPLYRRLPKLRGIAGGMSAGKKKFVTVNLDDLNEKFDDGEEVSLDSLKEKGVIKPSGKERKLPLKVLGNGDLEKNVTVKAAKFSKQALEKLEGADGQSFEVVPLKPKWTRQYHNQLKADGKWQKKKKLSRLQKKKLAKQQATA